MMLARLGFKVTITRPFAAEPHGCRWVVVEEMAVMSAEHLDATA